MKLADWLKEQGLSQKEFGRKIGRPQPTISRYLHGRVPESAIMQRIINVTKGAVRPDDFYRFPRQAAE